MTQNGRVRDEAIRAMIFVFVLLAIAEVAAPFFKITFHDPLLLTAFVTGILSHVIAPPATPKPHLLVVKEDQFEETVAKLREQKTDVCITFAESPDHALSVAKNMTPEKSGVIQRLKSIADFVK